MPAPSSVEEYIAGFPDDTRLILRRVRATLLEAIPGADEKVRYGMPAVMLGGRYAVHYAAWKKHLGLYPIPTADPELEAEITPFRTSKDSVNFVYEQPIPYDLIRRIAVFLMKKREADASSVQ